MYEVRTKKGEEMEIHSPSQLPETGEVDCIREPISVVVIHTPEDLWGP